MTIHLYGLSALFWLSSYVTNHCLAVVPVSGAKQNIYCTVYNKTLKLNCEAEKASKMTKKL
jgi:hypothetical protein